MVGRISAQVDQLHLQRHKDATGFFGFLEAEDSAETFHALFAAAENWLRQKGMQRVRGPFSLSINDECGLLVDGFDCPPPIMLGHALPYYGKRVEEQGYDKEQDLLAYRADPKLAHQPHLELLTKRFSRRVKVRMLRRDCFDEDLEIIRNIFEDAWAEEARSLATSGRRSAAESRARAYLQRFPKGTHAARMRQLLGAADE